MVRSLLVFSLLCFCIVEPVAAQQTTAKKDSINVYGNIESYSRRSKLTKFIYRLIFRPAPSVLPPQKKVGRKKGYKKLIKKPYSAYEGKVIRHIHIETLDPFGHSITNTVVAPRNYLAKAGNKMHVKSQRVTIRNLLLIRQNQIFDSLLVKESERLVRSRKFVRDVSFNVISTAKKSDSVDIYIRELDKWSITPKVGASTSRVVTKLNEDNFLGFGHEFKNTYTWYYLRGNDAYNSSYYIPNIRNTYISTSINYGTDEFRNFTKSVSVERPFFSAFTKWAAGVSYVQQFRKDSIQTSDSLFVLQNFKSNTQDYYIGNSMQIFKGNSETNRTTNFISAVRFIRTAYIERPSETIDTLNQYAAGNFYLGSIGISTRKYVQDKFIFNYGVTEDVPIGKVYSLTSGYQEKNNTGSMYVGSRISLGNYYGWGYLSSSFEYGTFFKASKAQQGMFIASIIYFTGLIETGKWKFRQFVKPQITVGINRFSTENLTINDGYGIDGFNSIEVTGTNRFLLKFQTQSYAPWDVLGFRFGPYLIYSIGMLGDASSGFKSSRVYSQLGFGVLIKNDNLVFNTFQYSISFYPLIPGNGQNIFKINSFKTSDFGFRDFEMARPTTLVYQ